MADAEKPTVTQPDQAESSIKTFADFLEKSSPDVPTFLPDVGCHYGANYVLNDPEIQLHCVSERCNGDRLFRQVGGQYFIELGKWTFTFVRYVCRNCGEIQKTFALAVLLGQDTHSAQVLKLGESPTFGPPVPSRVITLIGADREDFLRGRRAENNGLGKSGTDGKIGD